MKELHITLMREEVEALDNFKEICIFEREGVKVFVSLPQIKENVLRQDILERYNSSDYWDTDIVSNPDIPDREENK